MLNKYKEKITDPRYVEHDKELRAFADANFPEALETYWDAKRQIPVMHIDYTKLEGIPREKKLELSRLILREEEFEIRLKH